MDEDFNDAFDDAGFDVSPTPEPAQVGMASVDEGDALDYTQRTTIPGTNITGFISPQSYMETRGATATNPFPDSIFSRIFGAENVDYTNILGSGGVQDINNLRYRQAMGLPSLKTGQDYRMGDFYIGQPTMEGTVREVPRGGIMSMIPGISTVANLFGRNRGLPESSDAFKREMAKSQQSVQPLTDIINSITSGIGSFIDRFRPEKGGDRDTTTGRPIEPRGTELGDMTTTNAFIPDARVVVDNFNRPLSRTIAPRFISDMNQVPMLSVGNTGGITTTRPNMAQEADMEVAEALQLIPSNLETNPIAPVAKVKTSLPPSDIFNLLPTETDREKRDFARDVFTAFPDQRQKQFGRFNQDFINRTLNQKPFVDSGNFIVLD